MLNDEQNSFELLDIITIISFTLQIQNNENLKKQASNNEIMHELHNDMHMIIQKIDYLVENLVAKGEKNARQKDD